MCGMGGGEVSQDDMPSLLACHRSRRGKHYSDHDVRWLNSSSRNDCPPHPSHAASSRRRAGTLIMIVATGQICLPLLFYLNLFLTPPRFQLIAQFFISMVFVC